MMKSGKGNDALDWDARDDDMYDRLNLMHVWYNINGLDMIPRDNVVVILKQMAEARRNYRVERIENREPESHA